MSETLWTGLALFFGNVITTVINRQFPVSTTTPATDPFALLPGLPGHPIVNGAIAWLEQAHASSNPVPAPNSPAPANPAPAPAVSIPDEIGVALLSTAINQLSPSLKALFQKVHGAVDTALNNSNPSPAPVPTPASK